jgi:hypothetical protein
MTRSLIGLAGDVVLSAFAFGLVLELTSAGRISSVLLAALPF